MIVTCCRNIVTFSTPQSGVKLAGRLCGCPPGPWRGRPGIMARTPAVYSPMPEAKAPDAGGS